MSAIENIIKEKSALWRTRNKITVQEYAEHFAEEVADAYLAKVFEAIDEMAEPSWSGEDNRSSLHEALGLNPSFSLSECIETKLNT